MRKILKLDKNLANQIAAGEVVERPFSVVKELVENSIDAKAENIKVEITNGGIDEIIVTDNGIGIEKDDLEVIAEKYSTSKIKNLDDLYNIITFGFRGEAMASISSVSDMKIISKVSGQKGFLLGIIDGEKQKIIETASEVGSKIFVKNLFYNTPARLNYLKKPRTEANYTSKYLQEIALAYPEIGFEFISDGKMSFKYRQNEDLLNRIYNVYGEDFAENLIELNFEMTGMKVSGFISDPKVSFNNKNKQVIFVNKRPIKSVLISKAISDAYNRFIPHSSFPAYIINLEIDPTLVDVNVHPRKLEVRFANEQNIFRIFYHSINEKLSNLSLVKTENDILETENLHTIFTQSSHNLQITDNNFSKSQEKYYVPSGTKFKDYSPYKNTNVNPGQSTINNSFSKENTFLEPKNSLEDLNLTNDLHYTKLGKIIGQAHNSYIIVETKNGIQIYDQHALAERINYEKLIKNSKENKQNCQWLLIGENIILNPNEMDILEENIDIFKEMGFDLEILAGNSILVNGIPDFIKKENIKDIFLGILDDIGEHKFNKSKTLQEVKNRVFAYAACRGSIKFGNKLSLFEINKLLNDAVLDYSATCPHGRPVIFEMNLEELKGKYER
ncbi:DNA mismatch repair endonuclease MutL [Candidatus Gracilibacteria bacterium]|nr:DNA mismatch repair endonuclease MutL [Candidatus Gracilibacteria bacterium]